jgi:hypothetical protein
MKQDYSIILHLGNHRFPCPYDNKDLQKPTFSSRNNTQTQKLTFIHVEFEVLTVATMKNAVFWDVALCGFIINRRFEGRCRLHLQGRRHGNGEEKCQTVTNVSFHIPPKCQFIINPHSATSQKTAHTYMVTKVQSKSHIYDVLY